MQSNILEYLEASVAKFPDKIAIVDEHRSVSFAQLEYSATAFSAKLQEMGIETNTPVGVLLPKSITAIEAFLGTLIHGCFYMPLDVNNPQARINAILDKVSPSAIITSKQYKHLLPESKNSHSIIFIEDIAQTSQSIANNYKHRLDIDPAYLICTSGSTGTAKAVAISHKSIINYIDWAIATYGVNSEDIIGNQAPLIFDNSVLDIYLCLATACRLVLIPEKIFLFPAQLIEYLSVHEVNFIFWVPSIMTNIAAMDVLSSHKLKLDKILFAGEQMPTKTLNHWRDNISNALFSNLYGPTEITVDCTYYIVNKSIDNDQPVPIGFPCNNTQILILDEYDRLINSANKKGELCVKGICLALGYYNDAEKTAEVFVQNPLNSSYPEKIYRTGDLAYYNDDMELIYVGRKDFQFKHHGYRIDPGEIESAAMSLAAIEIACVLYDYDKRQIVLLYQAPNVIDAGSINDALIKLIPKYMLPKQHLHVEKIPMTTNGKTDRLALRNIYASDSE